MELNSILEGPLKNGNNGIGQVAPIRQTPHWSGGSMLCGRCMEPAEYQCHCFEQEAPRLSFSFEATTAMDTVSDVDSTSETSLSFEQDDILHEFSAAPETRPEFGAPHFKLQEENARDGPSTRTPCSGPKIRLAAAPLVISIEIERQERERPQSKQQIEAEMNAPQQDELVPENLRGAEDRLGRATKLLTPLQELAGSSIEMHLMDCEIGGRKVDVMIGRRNYASQLEKVPERDQKLTKLDDRADALQQGAMQCEHQAGGLRRLKSMTFMGPVIAVVILISFFVLVTTKGMSVVHQLSSNAPEMLPSQPQAPPGK